MKKITYILVLGIVLASCSKEDEISINDLYNNSDFELTTISKNSLFGAGEENIDLSTLIINNAEKWNSLVEKMNTTNSISDSFSETDIDFTKYTIIATYDKVRTTNGYEIEIKNASIKNSTLTVTIAQKSPERGDKVSTSIEQPYHIVLLPKVLTNKLTVAYD